MKLRYYAEAEVGVDHRRTLELLESVAEEHAIPVEVVQVEPTRAPPADFSGDVDERSLEDAWDDFTYNQTLQDGLGGAPSSIYSDPEDIVGNVGIVIDGELVWATRFWGTHHGWGPVDPEETAIGFLEEVEARGTAVLSERVPLDEWSPDTTDADASASAAASSDTPPAGELYKPTRDAIRDICTAQSFQRGVSYYEDGRVRELTLDGSDVTATVRGSAEYRVTADLSVKGFGGWCSCPYDYAGDCKHIVAVLLSVREQYDALFDQTATGEERDGDPLETEMGSPSKLSDAVDQAIDEADADTLRTFLGDILDDHEELQERFLATVDDPIEKNIGDYKQNIDQQFEAAADRRGIIEYDTHLDFAEFFDLATAYRENDRHEHALGIYRALSEGIRENLDRIDDSSGHYGRQIERAVDAYVECLSAAELAQDELQDHIEYLFEQYRSAEFVFVREYYDAALREVCAITDELEHLLCLLRPSLPIETEPRDDSRESDSTERDVRETTEDPTAVSSGQTSHDEGESEYSIPDPTAWRLDTELFTGGTLDIDRLDSGPLRVTEFIGETLAEILVDADTGRTEDVDVAEDHGGTSCRKGNRSNGTSHRDRFSIDEDQPLSTYLWVLSELDERNQLQAVLEEVYTERSEFYRQYVELLVTNGQDKQAQEVIETGLEEFPHTQEIYRLAAEFYDDRDQQRYREILQTLFVRFEDWNAYDDLKRACTDEKWQSISHGIATQLGRLDPDQLIDRYLYEDEYEKAFEKIIDSDDIEKLRQYRTDVADADPKTYFEAYKDLLEPYLAAETGRDHYRTVIEHLHEMEKLGLEDRFEAFIDDLKEKHSNRPAFQDELQKARLE